MALLHLPPPPLLHLCSFDAGFKSCSSMPQLKQFHSQLIRLGLSSHNLHIGRLLKFCALSPSGDIQYALHLFQSLPHPDAFIYNTLIRGYLLRHLPRSSILLYSQMLHHSVPPNKFTFPPLIRACSLHNALPEGKQLHAHVFKFGFGPDQFSQNNLILMYMIFQSPADARKVFDKMPRRDFVSWTSLVTGYSWGGLLDDAFRVFDSMPEKNSISWNAMIAAYVRSHCFHEAIALFNTMIISEVAITLDKFVVASMLSACTGLGALKQGELIHGYIEKSGIESDSALATKLIDMYCKCGCLDKALKVFDRLSPHSKEISLWNCMIGGLAMHGKAMDAIALFKGMEKEMVAPDYITFVNVLSACAHSGLVDEGRHFFRNMTEVHDIQPGVEHFGCMVDLLGRAGFLGEARKLADEMPIEEPQRAVGVLGALLGACKIHGNAELGEQIGKRAIELEPNNSGRYVLLANIYAKAGKWEDVANARKLMNDRGVKKVRGFSTIELDGAVNEFIAGGWTHPQAKEIYAKVDEMLECIRSIGYIPDTDGVLLHDIDEDANQDLLGYHSEKLAIAFGLLKTKPGDTLRISKNLRVCRDCHHASKLISKLFEREIIVRDRNRFHHFKGGECSCNDYW